MVIIIIVISIEGQCLSGPPGNKMQQKCEGQKYGLPAGAEGVGRLSLLLLQV